MRFVEPVLLVIAILVAAKLGCPITFREQRPGCNAEPFSIWKFTHCDHATMPEFMPTEDAEAAS